MPLLRRDIALSGGYRCPGAARTVTLWVALVVLLGSCGTEPNVPATVTLDSTALSFTALGQTEQLSSSVNDQRGDPLPRAAVTWTSSNPGVASVTSTGLVTAQGQGSAEVTATAGSATAAAQVVVTQTPAQLQKISGDGQTTLAGEMVAAPLIVQVNDGRSNPIAGATVIFTVSQGDGSIGASTTTTGTDGRASTTFTTDNIAGSSQAVSAVIAATIISVSFTATAAADPTSFNIGVRFLHPPTASQRQAFTDARLRWQRLITGDLDDALLLAPEGGCGPGTPAVDQRVDDVLILVSLVAIDGPGMILGGAGPCYVRDSDSLSVLGVMQFDTDDLETLESEGLLASVVEHEMGHVLGFGTLWQYKELLADAFASGGTDPHFTGTQAIAAFDDVGGTTYADGSKVPVEGTGSPGTVDSHWRESVFGPELMTGFINLGQNPLSIVTLGSLADLGYTVNLFEADSYTLTASLRALINSARIHLGNDILRLPVKKVNSRGRVTGVLQKGR